MTLPSPNLDDRAFQDLVDEAKRYVQSRCPEWTDHNVADPGVTLIETFAFMTDQLIYRLNRVPDLNYIKFLDLLGERMYPPAAAAAPITFWLSVPRPSDLTIPMGTQVSTVRTATDQGVTFSTADELTIVSTSIKAVLTQAAGSTPQDRQRELASGDGFPMFSPEPIAGDALYIGLTKPAPNCVVRVEADAQIDGIGVDPLDPPLAVDVWDGHAWVSTDIDADTTGGFNRRGTLSFTIDRHAVSSIKGIGAAWIRFRAVEPIEGQPPYISTPKIRSIKAATIGGIVDARHGRIVTDEILGESTGTAGQRFQLSDKPLIAGQSDLVLEVSTPNGWTHWRRVESFVDSDGTDPVFAIDDITGLVSFAPAVRVEDGSVRFYGAVPPAGATIRIRHYVAGGGRAGNVDAGALSMLRSSVPFVSQVSNRVAATGGVDAESIAEVKQRAAVTLRTRDRAVTARDYEYLVQRAAPSLARVRCVEAGEGPAAGTILVLVVPAVGEGQVSFDSLQPRIEILNQVKDFLDERRCLGSTVRIEPPRYLGVAVVARIQAKPGASKQRVAAESRDALRAFLHPTMGGYDRTGWPFGRPLFVGDVHAVLQDIPGVAYVDQVRLVPVDPVTGLRGQPADRVEPGKLELLFSSEHEIDVSP